MYYYINIFHWWLRIPTVLKNRDKWGKPGTLMDIYLIHFFFLKNIIHKQWSNVLNSLLSVGPMSGILPGTSKHLQGFACSSGKH